MTCIITKNEKTGKWGVPAWASHNFYSIVFPEGVEPPVYLHAVCTLKMAWEIGFWRKEKNGQWVSNDR